MTAEGLPSLSIFHPSFHVDRHCWASSPVSVAAPQLHAPTLLKLRSSRGTTHHRMNSNARQLPGRSRGKRWETNIHIGPDRNTAVIIAHLACQPDSGSGGNSRLRYSIVRVLARSDTCPAPLCCCCHHTRPLASIISPVNSRFRAGNTKRR